MNDSIPSSEGSMTTDKSKRRVQTFECTETILPPCQLCGKPGAHLTISVDNFTVNFDAHKTCFMLLATGIRDDLASSTT